MIRNLLDAVQHSLIDATPLLGFSVVEHEASSSFGNAQVVLQSSALRLRVIRDRGLTFVDFGAVDFPGVWFDSAVVFDWLKLSDRGGLHGSDADHVLRGASELLRACGEEISEKFSRSRFPRSKRELEDIRDSRAAKIYRFDGEK